MPRRQFLRLRRSKKAGNSPRKGKNAQVVKHNQPSYTNKLTHDELINAESALGRTLFGPVPEGHQREFFATKKNVWIWYERWTNASGALQDMLVRYEVRPTGVYKRANKGNYERIKGEELDNFRRAAKSYLHLVKSKLYC